MTGRIEFAVSRGRGGVLDALQRVAKAADRSIDELIDDVGGLGVPGTFRRYARLAVARKRRENGMSPRQAQAELLLRRISP
jgi:hypothetical protein